ncbi:hypothetical protein CVT24_005886 [Panaeolus cyanescens]|uniref:Uncharacterized protein n=1 Tax=Panaeolus cyanescens TaxID=181874 RepID=A0A409YEY2_9AGAR|nr:hypothetical protein CVT24_005886 [Panaeolus cyanescens]
MPPKPRKEKSICKCVYYGCINENFFDEETNATYQGRELSRQTFRNHVLKDDAWRALQAAPPAPGAGPHSVLQHISGILDPVRRERSPTHTLMSVTEHSEASGMVSDNSTLDTIMTDATEAPSPRRGEMSNDGPWIMPTLAFQSIVYLHFAIQSLLNLLVTWLYVICGLSRASATQVLKVLHNIVILSIQAGYFSAQQNLALKPKEAYFDTPLDVRTALSRLSIDPVIKRSVHCPTCFQCPKELTVNSIAFLLDPVVDQFEEMWTGAVIRTYLHPNGTFYRVAVLPGIGDLPGMRKAFGRAGVTAHRHMCSICKIHKSQIDDLDTSFPRHTGEEVADAGKRWKELRTIKERTELFAETGVRWSPMLRLAYRDPVKHTMLGMMHNWIEGILQHHVRILWSIGIPSGMAKLSRSKESKTQVPATQQVHLTTLSVNQQGFAMDVDDSTESDATMSEDTDAAFSDIASMSGEGVDDEEPEPRQVQTFTHEQLVAIRACISDAVVPSWVERPPSNLGEASHGKLKADKWLILFTVFLPIVLPEIWCSNETRHLLANFHHLTICTNIICSSVTNSAVADLYSHHYMEYRRSCLALFPDVKSRPNHHFAMHNGELMKYWGPLTKLSEFPGERMNGVLQKTKTNGRLRDMDPTMLRQVAYRGRFRALVQHQHYLSSKSTGTSISNDDKLKDSSYTTPTNLYHSSLGFISNINTPATPETKTTNHTHILSADDYDIIFAYLQSSQTAASTPFRRYDNFPHPQNANIYSYWATPHHSITAHSRLFSPYTTHRGNSCISFFQPGMANANGDILSVGFIQAIWTQEVNGVERAFLLVQMPCGLSNSDMRYSPFLRPELEGLMGFVAYDRVSDHRIVIERHHIQGHVPYYRRPPGTFGIQEGTIVMLNSLHRNR